MSLAIQPGGDNPRAGRLLKSAQPAARHHHVRRARDQSTAVSYLYDVYIIAGARVYADDGRRRRLANQLLQQIESIRNK